MHKGCAPFFLIVVCVSLLVRTKGMFNVTIFNVAANYTLGGASDSKAQNNDAVNFYQFQCLNMRDGITKFQTGAIKIPGVPRCYQDAPGDTFIPFFSLIVSNLMQNGSVVPDLSSSPIPMMASNFTMVNSMMLQKIDGEPWWYKYRPGGEFTYGGINGWDFTSIAVKFYCDPGNYMYKGCGDWFYYAHFLVNTMGKTLSGLGAQPYMTVGRNYKDNMEFYQSSIYAALGSISCALTWLGSGIPPAFTVVFGLSSETQGRTAYNFLCVHLAHNRLVAFHTVEAFSAEMAMALQSLASPSQQISRIMTDKIELGFLAITGMVEWSVFEVGVANSFAAGFYIMFFYVDYFGVLGIRDQLILGQRPRWHQQSVLLMTGDHHYDFTFESGWQVLMITHAFSIRTNVPQSYKISMDIKRSKQWDLFCIWFVGHLGASKMSMKGSSYKNILKYQRQCISMSCFRPDADNVCAAQYTKQDFFWEIGYPFLTGLWFFNIKRHGWFQFDAFATIEYARQIMLNASAGLSQASLVSIVKNDVPFPGFGSGLNWTKNGVAQHVVPNIRTLVFQITHPDCDNFLTLYWPDGSVNILMEFDAHSDQSSKTNKQLVGTACNDHPQVDRFLNCNPGTEWDPQVGVCKVCPAGRKSSGGPNVRCSHCPGGTSSKGNASDCDLCPAGKVSSKGDAGCTLCESGKFNPYPQRTKCDPCRLGHFGPRRGLASCERCGVGSYSSKIGSVICTECTMPYTFIEKTGAVSPSDCKCIPRYYKHNETLTCKYCYDSHPVDAVSCPGPPSESMVTVSGHMTFDSTKQLYICSQCQGNFLLDAPTTVQCPRYSSGVACSLCANSWVWHVHFEKCEECVDEDFTVGFTLSFLILFLMILFRLIPVTPDFDATWLENIIVVANVCAPVSGWIDFCQICMMLFNLEFPWPENLMNWMGRIGSYFAFDLFSMECHMENKFKYAQLHVMMVNFVPLGLIVFILICSLPSVLSRALRKLRFPSPILACNVCITLINVFIISIINFSMNVPFNVLRHPRSPGLSQVSSLRRFPYLLTDSGEALKIRVIGGIMVTFWLLLMSMVVVILQVLPRKRHWKTFRRCMLPLVLKYSDNCSYFILVDLAFKSGLSMAVVFFTSNRGWQFQNVGILICTYFPCVIACMPHRFPIHAFVDGMRGIFIALLFFSTFLLLDESGDPGLMICWFMATGLVCVACQFVCIHQAVETVCLKKGVSHYIERQRALLGMYRLVTPRRSQRLAYLLPGSKRLQDLDLHEQAIDPFSTSAKTHDLVLQMGFKQSSVIWILAKENEWCSRADEIKANIEACWARLKSASDAEKLNIFEEFARTHDSLLSKV